MKIAHPNTGRNDHIHGDEHFMSESKVEEMEADMTEFLYSQIAADPRKYLLDYEFDTELVLRACAKQAMQGPKYRDLTELGRYVLSVFENHVEETARQVLK